MKYTLREYQNNAVGSALRHYNKYEKPFVIVMPTGAGKSLIISELCHKLNEPVLILQPTKEILEQNYNKLLTYGVEDISIYSASLKTKEIDKYCYATIGSIYKKPELFKHFKYVLLDECDLLNPRNIKGMYNKFFEAIACKHICGLTATPYRLLQRFYKEKNEYGITDTYYTAQLMMINRIFPFFFKRLAYKISIKELIDKGYLCKLNYKTYTDFDISKVKINTTGADYDSAALDRFWDDKRLRRLANIIAEIDLSCKHNLIFCSSIKQGTRCVELLREMGYSTDIVTSQDKPKRRDDIINRFRAGEIKHMVNVNVLSVGFDFPALDSITLARPTISLRMYYQQCLTTDIEVLTPEGFKRYNEIEMNNLIYGFDTNTSEIRIVNVQDKILRKKYEFEKVLEYSSTRIDMAMSDHHEVIVKSRRAKRWVKKKLKEALLYNESWWVPVAGFENPSGENALAENEILLLGWFLSDGSINKRGVARISQSMKNKKYVLEIENLLNSLNIGYTKCVHKRKGEDSKYEDLVHFVFCKKTKKRGKIGYGYIKEYFDKNLPLCYGTLSRDQLLLLLSTIIKGDGINKTPRNYKVRTHSITCGDNKIYAERLQSLCVRRGLKANLATYLPTDRKPEYILRITNTVYSPIAGSNVEDNPIKNKKNKRTRFSEIKNYNDDLWCLTNELGTLIIRRNGKVSIVGNCGRGMRPDPERPDKECQVIDITDNVKKLGRVETIEVKKEDGGFRDIVVTEVGEITGKPLFKFKLKDKEKIERLDGVLLSE